MDRPYLFGSVGPIPGSVVRRDANGNAFANNFFSAATSTVSAGGTTTLTAASPRYQRLSGSLSQNFVLPDATTLPLGPVFIFNNESSGSLVVKDSAGTTLYTVPAGGLIQVGVTSNATAAGTWTQHPFPPGTVTWGGGTTGLVMNTALSTSASINAGASSATAPVFIPQRGAATTGFGGDGASLFAILGGATKFTFSGTAGTGLSIAAGTAASNAGRALSISQTWTDGTSSNIGIVGNFDMGATGTATGKLLSLQAGAAGITEMFSVGHTGQTIITGGVLWLGAANEFGIFNSAGFRQQSGAILGFSSAADNSAASDSALSRVSAGVIGVGTGATGSFAGRLKLTSTITAAVAVSALNASPTVGEIQTVNDASAVTAKGATVAAGGSSVAVVVWNGSNWVGI